MMRIAIIPSLLLGSGRRGALLVATGEFGTSGLLLALSVEVTVLVE